MGEPAPNEHSRAASDADLPRLAELAAAAVAELSAGRGGAVWARTAARTAPYEARFTDELASEVHHVVAGTLDDVVLGYGVARVDVLADGGRLGVVTDLYTEADGRGVGIGELMMGALVEWCTAQDCFGIDSVALPGDRHTKNFFEAFGLVARAITVHRSLP